MATNEDNARDIVHQCIVESNTRWGDHAPSPTKLADRIVACLAEVGLIPDDEPRNLYQENLDNYRANS